MNIAKLIETSSTQPAPPKEESKSELEYKFWLTLPLTIKLLNELEEVKKDLLHRAMSNYSNTNVSSALLLKAQTIDTVIKFIKDPDPKLF